MEVPAVRRRPRRLLNVQNVKTLSPPSSAGAEKHSSCPPVDLPRIPKLMSCNSAANVVSRVNRVFRSLLNGMLLTYGQTEGLKRDSAAPPAAMSEKSNHPVTPDLLVHR